MSQQPTCPKCKHEHTTWFVCGRPFSDGEGRLVSSGSYCQCVYAGHIETASAAKRRIAAEKAAQAGSHRK